MHPSATRPGWSRWWGTTAGSPAGRRALRVAANLVGAGSAAAFSYSFLQLYLRSHQLIGLVFLAQQTLVVVAYLARRPARAVTRRSGDWLLAFGGTFAGVLFSPQGTHTAWGIPAGLALQLLGAALAITSLVTLGRSFGFAAADRGLVTRGPYAVVRHPMYTAYALGQAGFLLQSLSIRNGAVLALGCMCNIGRVRAEERLLVTGGDYSVYRRRVPWRLLPGVW